ncbi:MAG: NAD(P)H-hydrate epimerase [Phycisphaerales bacterium]|nr:NAD(P)H-hydrate epimerase [Phycisphaerales bacterium]
MNAPGPQPCSPGPESAPTLTRAQVRALDQWAINDLGIPSIVLMESAAASIGHAIIHTCVPTPDTNILIACGPGNNGGDGFAVARRLHNRGLHRLVIGLARPSKTYQGDAATNLHIAQRMGLSVQPLDAALTGVGAHAESTLVIDALFGTGLDRPLAGADAVAVQAINNLGRTGAFVFAIDLPSGMDADTGIALGGVAVQAHATCTLAARKPGLDTPAGKHLAGLVTVGDIGIAPPRPES